MVICFRFKGWDVERWASGQLFRRNHRSSLSSSTETKSFIDLLLPFSCCGFSRYLLSATLVSSHSPKTGTSGLLETPNCSSGGVVSSSCLCFIRFKGQNCPIKNNYCRSVVQSTHLSFFSVFNHLTTPGIYPVTLAAATARNNHRLSFKGVSLNSFGWRKKKKKLWEMLFLGRKLRRMNNRWVSASLVWPSCAKWANGYRCLYFSSNCFTWGFDSREAKEEENYLRISRWPARGGERERWVYETAGTTDDLVEVAQELRMWEMLQHTPY